MHVVALVTATLCVGAATSPTRDIRVTRPLANVTKHYNRLQRNNWTSNHEHQISPTASASKILAADSVPAVRRSYHSKEYRPPKRDAHRSANITQGSPQKHEAHHSVLTSTSTPPSALDAEESRSWSLWLTFVVVVAAALAIEEICMRDLPSISINIAVLWLCSFITISVGLLTALGMHDDSWAEPGAIASLMLLNMVLSPDNLVVFMMFVSHSQLRVAHHRRVISDGLLLAIALRLGTMLVTSKLVEAFSSLQLVLAALVFGKGVQMLWAAAMRSATDEAGDTAPAKAPWLLRSLQGWGLVEWSDATDGACCASRDLLGRDEGGRCCMCRSRLTRTAALAMAIGVADISFSSDNIAAILALSTDVLELTVSTTLSSAPTSPPIPLTRPPQGHGSRLIEIAPPAPTHTSSLPTHLRYTRPTSLLPQRCPSATHRSAAACLLPAL